MTDGKPQSEDWKVATIRSEEGDVLARFDFSRRFVLHDIGFSRAIWFDLTPGNTSDIDEYLRSLDSLEDTVRCSMARLANCHMLIALSDATGRQLVFAHSGERALAEEAALSIQSNSQGNVSATILGHPQFGPFATLVRGASGASN